MGKSGEEFLNFIERQHQEAEDESKRKFYEDMERQYYQAQEERAYMETDEYKQRKEEIRKTLWGVFNHFHPHTWI